MNHPLNHRGWRFFNGSPLENEVGQRRGVSFIAARNPGYWGIILGSAITVLGVILVLFYKQRFRRWEDRRRKARGGGGHVDQVTPELSAQGV